MMIQTQDRIENDTETELITLDRFFEWYPDSGGRYELRDGVIRAMQPTGTHEQVSGFLAIEFSFQIRQQTLPLTIPRQCIIKKLSDRKSGFNPDITVLNIEALTTEPLWQKRSAIMRGESVHLAVEVVSTNWQDDYLTKLGEYEQLGIPEYWIVDYLGLGGRRYIDYPKQPTITICTLVDREYQMQLFRGSQQLVSIAFPHLELTADRVFQAGLV